MKKPKKARKTVRLADLKAPKGGTEYVKGGATAKKTQGRKGSPPPAPSPTPAPTPTPT